MAVSKRSYYALLAMISCALWSCNSESPASIFQDRILKNNRVELVGLGADVNNSPSTVSVGYDTLIRLTGRALPLYKGTYTCSFIISNSSLESEAKILSPDTMSVDVKASTKTLATGVVVEEEGDSINLEYQLMFHRLSPSAQGEYDVFLVVRADSVLDNAAKEYRSIPGYATSNSIKIQVLQ